MNGWIHFQLDVQCSDVMNLYFSYILIWEKYVRLMLLLLGVVLAHDLK